MKTGIKINTTLNHSGSISLMIELSEFGIDILIMNESLNQIMGFENYEFELYDNHLDCIQKIITPYLSFKDNLKEVLLRYDYHSILIPNKVYSDSLKKEVYNLIKGVVESQEITSEYNTTHDLYIVYPKIKEVHNYLSTHLNVNEISHSNNYLLENSIYNTKMICIFYHQNIKVILYNKNQLQVIEKFEFKTPEDVIYILQNTCKQFNISSTDIALKLCGFISEESPLYKQIYNYFLDVEFYQFEKNVTLSESFEHLPKHFMSHLIQLIPCA